MSSPMNFFQGAVQTRVASQVKRGIISRPSQFHKPLHPKINVVVFQIADPPHVIITPRGLLLLLPISPALDLVALSRKLPVGKVVLLSVHLEHCLSSTAEGDQEVGLELVSHVGLWLECDTSNLPKRLLGQLLASGWILDESAAGIVRKQLLEARDAMTVQLGRSNLATSEQRMALASVAPTTYGTNTRSLEVLTQALPGRVHGFVRFDPWHGLGTPMVVGEQAHETINAIPVVLGSTLLSTPEPCMPFTPVDSTTWCAVTRQYTVWAKTASVGMYPLPGLDGPGRKPGAPRVIRE